MRRCFFFIIETSDRMQFFTILQGKLHPFNIQDDRSTRFLWTTNYRIDLIIIINRFHGENSIMPGLFNHKNLILCGIQGNNGLLAKTFKKISKITYTASRFSLLTSAKFAGRAVVRSFNIIKNLLCLFFI